MGNPSPDSRGRVRVRFKEKADRKGEDTPSGVSQIHMVPGRNIGPIR
jgi:hypothetical protein